MKQISKNGMEYPALSLGVFRPNNFPRESSKDACCDVLHVVERSIDLWTEEGNFGPRSRWYVDSTDTKAKVVGIWTQQAVQSGAAHHSQGFEDKNLGSSPGLLGQ